MHALEALVRVLVRDDEDCGKGKKKWDPRNIFGIECVGVDDLLDVNSEKKRV